MNIKVWLANIWIWLAVIIGTACSRSFSVPIDGNNSSLSNDKVQLDNNDLPNKRVHFNVTDCTRDTYHDFMLALRASLSSGTRISNIPLMRRPSDSQEVLLVELVSLDQEHITLVVNVMNAYVIAYHARETYYLLADTPENFFDRNQPLRRLSFQGSYPDLQRVAGRNRVDIDLGMNELSNAITTLYRWSPPDVETTVASSLIILIQMVSEAARYRIIERDVIRNIIQVNHYTSFRPTGTMISLENNWQSLSKSIQQPNEGGTITPPILLVGRGYTQVVVDNVAKAVLCSISLLYYYSCRDRTNQASLSPHGSSVLSTSFHLNITDDDSSCEHPEPTVRIIGYNGDCMDVRGGLYNGNGGDPVILWPCKDNDDVNQLWTLGRDGTIRSNGMCLTAYGYNAGDYVMIYNCHAAVYGATLWTMEYGSIINWLSGLAIGTADPVGGVTELKMQRHIYASGQGWLASNNTELFVTTIMGLDNFCMEINVGDYTVGLSGCDDNKEEQKWYIFGDGSIRPWTNQTCCMTSQSDEEWSRIILLSCQSGDTRQRWMFTSEGFIYNMRNGLVMDVKLSDPSLQEIIIWHITGNSNQIWFTSL